MDAFPSAPSTPSVGNVVAMNRPDDMVRWMPRHRGILARIGGAGLYGAGTLVLLGGLGAGAWLLTPPATPTNATFERQISDPSPRLEQITAAVRAPLLSSDEDAATAAAPRAPTLAIEGQGIAIEAGTRGKLPARVENEDVLEPETVALVGGLPVEAELTEGIKIGPKLWMLRPGLLGTTAIDTGSSPAGRHDLMVELRGPTGSIVASAHTTLEITRPAVAEAGVTPSAAVIETENAGAGPKAGRAEESPAIRKSAKRKERYAAPAVAPVEVTRPKIRAKPLQATATRNEQSGMPKETRETRSMPQPGTRVLSSGPAIPQTPQGQRLVWPGDDPRAAYTQSPPVFLGGPGVQPRSGPQVEREDPNWQKRAFGQ